jgi:hypothetical protein
MTEVTVGNGDSVSKLIQLAAKEVGIKDLRYTGKGQDDTKMICVELFNSRLLKDSLWTGMTELCQMPEMKELPERIQAKMMAIILTARGKFELGVKGMDAKT